MRLTLLPAAAVLVCAFVSHAAAQGSWKTERAARTTATYNGRLAAEPADLVPVIPAPPAPAEAPPAEEPAPSDAQPSTAAEPAAVAEPSGLRRMWDIVKILPIFFYTPETSVGFGAGTLFQFRMPGAKAEGRPSSVTLGAVYTLEKQTVMQVTPDLRFGDDDYVLKLDLLGAKYPNRFYGIGNNPDESVFDKYTDCYMRGEADFRVRPFARTHALAPLYIGAHYASGWSRISDPRAEDPDNPSMFARVHDRGEAPLFASGVGPSLAWDSRQGINWPRGGSFVEIKATAFEPWMGSDVRYRRLVVDARRYQLLWLDHILAMRFVAQSVWGEVPFQRLPQLGGASLFRGWFTGQLRGPRLLAVEAEYRAPIGKRFAAVAFGSVGRVGTSIGGLSPKGLHVAGGGGLRVSVDRRDRINLRLDLAYGDSFYPYLQFREAF